MSETYTLTKSWLDIRERVLDRDCRECNYCRVSEPVAELEVHHIIPVRLNGSDDMDNLITLCSRCHGAIHRLGDDPEYPLSVLENAKNDQTSTEPTAEEIEERYSVDTYQDNTPEGWTKDEWAEKILDTEAPKRATLTTKTIDGRDYYYFQWQVKGEDKITSEYIAPVKNQD